jgi:RluA family pseudouridine synthase
MNSSGLQMRDGIDPTTVPILYDDQDVLAVSKPEGLASIPTRDQGEESLLTRLAAALAEKVYVVHRLDKEASGIILFARNAAAHRHLNEQFSHGQVRKTYLALAHGLLEAETGVIDQPLREFGSGRVAVDLERGRPCTTQYLRREFVGPHTLVEARPLTGRRHQIRVHFYSIGHPLVGDPRYGEAALQAGFPRLMLHAHRLEFQFPSGARVMLEAPLPPSFTAVVERCRAALTPEKGEPS